MTTMVMSVEGVLTDHPASDTVLNYEATATGRLFYNMVKPTARIILLSSDPYIDRVKAWLVRERFTGYAAVYCHPLDSVMGAQAWKAEKVKDLVGLGHHIGFYVDTDPTTVENVLSIGVDSLLVANPSTYPGDREDTKYSPWYSLVEKVEGQNLARATKMMEEEDALHAEASD